MSDLRTGQTAAYNGFPNSIECSRTSGKKLAVDLLLFVSMFCNASTTTCLDYMKINFCDLSRALVVVVLFKASISLRNWFPIANIDVMLNDLEAKFVP